MVTSHNLCSLNSVRIHLHHSYPQDIVYEFGHSDDFCMKGETKPKVEAKPQVPAAVPKPTSAPTVALASSSANTKTPAKSPSASPLKAAATPAPTVSATATPASVPSSTSASPPAIAADPVVPAPKPVPTAHSAMPDVATDVPARVEVNPDIQSVVSEPSVSTMLPQQQVDSPQLPLGLSPPANTVMGTTVQQQQQQLFNNPIGGTPAAQQPQPQQGFGGFGGSALGGATIGGATIGGSSLAPFGSQNPVNLGFNNDMADLQRLMGSALLHEATAQTSQQQQLQPPLQQTPSAGLGFLQSLQQYQQPSDQPQQMMQPQLQQQQQQIFSQASPAVAAAPSGQGQKDSLLAFLEANKACLKGSPAEFCGWLRKEEDINSLADLADAVQDDEYLHDVLQAGNGSVGVKGFKRAAFKKVAMAAAGTSSQTGGSGSVMAEATAAAPSSTVASSQVETKTVVSSGGVSGTSSNNQVQTELVCPISHVLMVNDPVIASDGYTYSKAAIEMWIQRQRSECQEAIRILHMDPNNKQARAVAERGILSPLTHQPLPNPDVLLPNHNVRQLAREAERATGGDYTIC